MNDTRKRSDKPNVWLVAGFPGAGKSLLTKLGRDLLGAAAVSMDDIYESMAGHERFLRYDDRVLEAGLEAALREVRRGRSVMIDSCFKDPRERAEALRVLAPCANVYLIDITTPVEICRQRASRRPHTVDEEAYAFHCAVAAPPDAGEGFAAIFPFDNLTDEERAEYEAGAVRTAAPLPADAGPGGHLTDAQLGKALRHALAFLSSVADAAGAGAETGPLTKNDAGNVSGAAVSDLDIELLIRRARSWEAKP